MTSTGPQSVLSAQTGELAEGGPAQEFGQPIEDVARLEGDGGGQRDALEDLGRPARAGAEERTRLTAEERHYLNKALVCLQLQKEVASLSQIGTLASYGPPFHPHPTGPNTTPLHPTYLTTDPLALDSTASLDPVGEIDPPSPAPAAGFLQMLSAFIGLVPRAPNPEWLDWSWEDKSESTICRYLFSNYVLKFPVLRLAKPSYWTDHIQPFFDSFAERSLSDGTERGEVTKRQMLSLALTRLLGTYVASCLKPAGLVFPASPPQETQTLIDELVDGDGRPAWKAIGERTRALHKAWRTYRRGLVEGDELERSFKIVRETPFIKDLPPFYSEAAEFSRIWVSNALHFIFIASPNGPEIVKLSKSFHDLIPYGALKLGLSLGNPTLAIRAIVAIVLGQPACAQSLFQRVFSIVLGSTIKSQHRQVKRLRLLVNNDSLSDALLRYINAGHLREVTRDTAKTGGEEVIITILRDEGDGELLATVQSWLEAGDESWWRLKELLRAYVVKRDLEQVLQLLHASIRIFYSTLYAVANATNLAARLGDYQAFLDDLLNVCLSEKHSPSDFIELCARHEQSLFFFVRELANAGDLMQPLIDFCRLLLDFLKPHEGQGVNLDALLEEVEPDVAQQVLKEVRELAQWSRIKKSESDINLRFDLLGATTSLSSSPAAGSDLILSAFLDMDPLSQSYVSGKQEEVQAEKEESPISWAWFNALGSSSALIPTRTLEGVAEKETHEKGMDPLRIDPPEFRATRLLLGSYERRLAEVLCSL